MILSLHKNLKILALVGLVSSGHTVQANPTDIPWKKVVVGAVTGAVTLAGTHYTLGYFQALGQTHAQKKEWIGKSKEREIEEKQETLDLKKQSYNIEQSALERHAQEHGCEPETCNSHKNRKEYLAGAHLQIQIDSDRLTALRKHYEIEPSTKELLRANKEKVEEENPGLSITEVNEKAYELTQALLIAGHPLTSHESE